MGRVTQRGRSGPPQARETRDVIGAPAPSRIAFDVQPGQGTQLDVGMGLVPGGVDRRAVRFSVLLEDPAGAPPQTLADVEVPAWSEDWLGRSVDLSPWAGRAVRLVLVTEPLEADDIETVRAFAADDPYSLAGLFANVDVRPWNWTVGNPDGGH